MEVETGGIFSEYIGNIINVLYRTVEKLSQLASSRDKFQFYVTMHDFGYLNLRNLQLMEGRRRQQRHRGIMSVDML